ncbi:hypothetical protein G7Z17_g8689 [Cylindrodendrum hubeiense]|uniref:alpha-glucosidase n=1 Tax=Cylindrodendrum hubeiense TaxID=595255 RepID=A0A9P5H4R2_9HYPO|nr:hypothetical protein G7Z17_g8689 [Cylindrodendrum hubeiense]
MSAPNDPLNFIPADVFCTTVPSFHKPGQVMNVISSDSTDRSDPLRYASHVLLKGPEQNPDTHCLVQFVTPQIWRIRYNPKFSNVGEYSDANSRTIVMDSFANLVDCLQEEYRETNAWNAHPAGSNWSWKTLFEKRSPEHWVLSATRVLKPLKSNPSFLNSVGVLNISDSEHVIWQTTAHTFSYQSDPNIGVINNVVLKINKPTPAEYLGFGEQGGRTVLKKPTYMNFFCMILLSMLKSHCYGYSSSATVNGIVDGYRQSGIPLDGMHLDVDFQPGYYPDLNRAAARDKWGQQYQQLFDDGLEFVWQDMTTPAAGDCYGDMLGLLMSDDAYDQDATVKPPTKTAIELWGLYSYNLHKATYHGLNKLKGRENKRNFIIGRGSLTGMHRFAGLWTGDNGSSWDFWRISVAQVIALGYSGMTIAGVDMGGFTYDPEQAGLLPPHWCDPELLIRWYTGAFLLPWYRNHYNQHFDTKVFQVLYDTMFENLINGLPIARAMLITDPDDTTLFNANEDFIDTQYLLGHNILVCPVLNPGVYNRDIYLLGSDLWYLSNLRVDVQGYGTDPQGLKHAAQLEKPVSGGTTVYYGCGIPNGNDNPSQIAFVTPVYIRGGAIIPQIDVRQSIEEGDLNPPTIHIYPGDKKTEYSMYLDDGVSRDSAPAYLPQYKHRHAGHDDDSAEAKSKFREVKITQ